ncbi:MAG: hypothetical protein IPG72_09145 [Ardenticatenales bacterium]|nr:hypothetical protein [Ardenticatenales bacterium]
MGDLRQPDALPIVAEVHNVAVEGHVAYAITEQMNGGGTDRNNRLLDTFDFPEPAAPRHVGRLPLGGVAYRLAVAGSRVIVRGGGGDGGGGMVVVRGRQG